MNKILLLLFIVNISCYSDNLTEILSIAKNNALRQILKNNKVEIKKTDGNDYYYVFSPINSSDDEENSYKLNGNYNIDGFNFKENEQNWWFIYNKKKDKIIIKETQPGHQIFIGSGNFDLENNYFYFNLGTYTIRRLYFYSLENEKLNLLNIEFIVGGIDKQKKHYLFSPSKKFLVLTYPYNENQCLNGIKIVNVIDKKEILIEPSKENQALRIVKWTDNSKLQYKEIDREKNSFKELDEKTIIYTIK